MQFHEVRNFWVRFDLSHGLYSLSPGVVCWSSSPSSFSGVSLMLRQVTSLHMADEAFLVSNMLRFFVWGEIDLVYVYGVRVMEAKKKVNCNITPFLHFELPGSIPLDSWVDGVWVNREVLFVKTKAR